MRSRRLGAITVLIASTSLASLAVGTAVAQDPVALSMWKAPHSADDETFWRGRLDAYQGEHPGVTVEYRLTPWDTWVETYTSAFAGSAPPDVFYGVGIYYPKLVDAGALIALDEAFPDQTAALQPQFDTSLWAGGGMNGHQYGIPFLQAGISFIWNKDLFTAAGLDPEVPPATWDDVKAYAKQIKDAVPDAYGYGIIDNSTGELLNFYPSPMFDYGAEMLSPDGSTWTFDSPEAVAGLSVLADMYKDGLVAPFGLFPGHDIDTAFVQGKIGMMLSYSSYVVPLLKDYPDFKIGVGAHPCGPANCKSLGAGGYWMLAEKSANKDAALELATWLGEKETLTDYVKLTNLFGARTDFNPWEGDELMSAFQATQQGYGDLARLPFDYWAILNPEVENAISGASPVDEALTTAGDQIRAKMTE